MASTYTSRLRLDQMAKGDQNGTWGTTVNKNLRLVEDAISGLASVAHTDAATLVLTTVNGEPDQARCAMIEITGALTAKRQVILPSSTRFYLVANKTTGGFALDFKTSGGAAVEIANGSRQLIYVDADGNALSVGGSFATLTGKPTTLAGYGITDAVAQAGATMSGQLVISKGGATVAGTHLLLQPTDMGAGKPGLYFNKTAAAATWQMVLYDGVNNNGILDIFASNLRHGGQTIWDAGNDGPGSGLNADLLDGVQGSEYLQSAAFLASTPLWTSNQIGVSGSSPRIRLLDNGTLDAYILNDGGAISLRNGSLASIHSFDINTGAIWTAQLGDLNNKFNTKTDRNSQVVWNAGLNEFGSIHVGPNNYWTLDLPNPWVVAGLRSANMQLYLRGVNLRTQ